MFGRSLRARELFLGIGLLALACSLEAPSGSDAYTQAHASLIAASTSSLKTTAGRLNGFPVRRLPPSGAKRERRPDSGPEIRMAAARIDADLAAQRNAATLGAAASLQLMLGRPGLALELIDEALAKGNSDERLLIDRGAALLAADSMSERAAEIAAMVDRLMASNPPDHHSRGAWHFNEALLLSRLGLAAEAADELRRAAMSGDEWAQESAHRAEALALLTTAPGWERGDRQRLLAAAAAGDAREVARLTHRWPVAAAVLVEDELLADSRNGRGQALLVALVLARRGDTFLSDSLQSLSGHGADVLAEAHRVYAAGRHLQRGGQCEAAQAQFDLAAVSFERHASPFAALADLRWASCAHQGGQFELAIARLRARLERLPPRHLDVRGRLEWLLGLHELEIGDPAAALAHYRSAADVFARARLDEGIATAEMLSAEAWWQLGESAQAWSHRRRALSRLLAVSDEQRQRTILDEAAEASAGDGLVALGDMLQSRVVASALRADNDFALPMALTQRARVRLRRGDPAGGIADLTSARRGIEAMPDTALRRNLDAYLLLVEAEAVEVSDPREAIRKLARASVHYDEMNRWEPSRTAALRTARCYLRLGKRQEALAALERANAIGERLRQQGSDGVRGALDSQAQPLFDELVRLELAGGNVDAAFRYSELGRARRLVEASGGSQVSLSALRALLQAQTAILVYHDLGERLAVFVIRSDATSVQQLEKGELAREASSLRRALSTRSRERDWRTAAMSLRSRLIDAVEPQLEGVTSLIIVPHRALTMVPFASLLSAGSGRFLVEDYRLQIAPSASLFAAAIGRRRPTPPAQTTVLAAGAAAPSPGLTPVLAALAGADEEARAVAAVYPTSHLLTGEQTTSARFLRLARRSHVVHFAGHAVASASDPAQSFLVMASSSDGDHVLYAREIDREAWPLTQLVVLSACHTAQTSQRDAEGVQGLARAFLSAGVPAVVATLWDIEDSLATRVSLAFHDAHSHGVDPASALRSAQLSVLAEDHDAPPAWAAFAMIGGVEETTIH